MKKSTWLVMPQGPPWTPLSLTDSRLYSPPRCTISTFASMASAIARYFHHSNSPNDVSSPESPYQYYWNNIYGIKIIYIIIKYTLFFFSLPLPVIWAVANVDASCQVIPFGEFSNLRFQFDTLKGLNLTNRPIPLDGKIIYFSKAILPFGVWAFNRNRIGVLASMKWNCARNDKNSKTNERKNWIYFENFIIFVWMIWRSGRLKWPTGDINWSSMRRRGRSGSSVAFVIMAPTEATIATVPCFPSPVRHQSSQSNNSPNVTSSEKTLKEKALLIELVGNEPLMSKLRVIFIATEI